MRKSRSQSNLLLVATACLLLLLTGCHSSKSVVYGGGGTGQSLPASGSGGGRDISDPMGRDLVEAAVGWLGTKYRYGGSSRDGTDCSGFVMSLYRDVCAVKLPRTTTDQYRFCSSQKRKDARAGDLVFFGGKGGKDGVSHVGLYIGKGEMIHASSSRGVIVSNVDDSYWGPRFKSVGRVESAPASWAMYRGKKGKKDKKDKDKNLVIPSATPMASVKDGPDNKAPEVSVDLIDLIINQKVDSIFSSQFMD